MKLFLKLVLNDFTNESRDKREISVVNKLNYEVIVIAKGEHNGVVRGESYDIHRRTTRPLGDNKLLNLPNRLFGFFTWASYARKLKPYCISCHDLSALLIGWVSTLFVPKKNRPFLVYDSHEFELGRNVNGARSKLCLLLISRLEKFLANRSLFSIMVNESIAKEVKKIHKLDTMPVVVRNIPEYWNVDKNVCAVRKKEICNELNVPDHTFLVMYHGSVLRNRGIENLLISISKNKNIVGIILGNGDEDYIKSLKKMTNKLNVSNRVMFHEAVSIEILWEYVGAADVGMITIPPVTKSYYYMLPNKLFENIQSLTPVICSDLPEVRKIVKKYDIGLLVNPENSDDIAKAIEQMRTDTDMYIRFKENLSMAKNDLCWENESKILEQAYKKI